MAETTREERIAEIARRIDDAANGPFGRADGRWLLRELRLADAENARLREALAELGTPDPRAASTR